MAQDTNSGLTSSAIVKTFENMNFGGNNAVDALETLPMGVHAAYPSASPKYMLHQGQRRDFTDTMARMFIQVPPGLYKAFMASLKSDTDLVTISRALVGDNDKQGGAGYIDFFLQRAHHALNDKYQVSETLADNFVAFFFGMQAPVFSYTGVLMNTYQDYWAARMLRIFTELGRGTQLARRKFVMRLRYDNMIVSGAMVNFEWDLMAENEMACPFNFNLLVTQVDLLFGGVAEPTTLFTGTTKFAPTADTHIYGSPEVALGSPAQAMAASAPADPAAQPQGVSQPVPAAGAQPVVTVTGNGVLTAPEAVANATGNIPDYPGAPLRPNT